MKAFFAHLLIALITAATAFYAATRVPPVLETETLLLVMVTASGLVSVIVGRLQGRALWGAALVAVVVAFISLLLSLGLILNFVGS